MSGITDGWRNLNGFVKGRTTIDVIQIIVDFATTTKVKMDILGVRVTVLFSRKILRMPLILLDRGTLYRPHQEELYLSNY